MIGAPHQRSVKHDDFRPGPRLRMTDVLLDQPQGEAIPLHALTEQALAGFLQARAPALARQAALSGFKAKAGQVLVAPDGAASIALFGLGEGARPDGMALRALPAKLPPGDYVLAAPIEAVAASRLALAWALGAYAFDRYRKTPGE